MENKKINFKQPRYLYPLFALPVVLFTSYAVSDFIGNGDKNNAKKQVEQLDLSLGETNDSILSKNDAYDMFYKNGEKRTMLDGLQDEKDSLSQYSDNLDYKQKRFIDSVKAVKASQNLTNSNMGMNDNYYKSQGNNKGGDKDFQRSASIIRMLNGKASGNGEHNSTDEYTSNTPRAKEKEEDPIKMLRRQMLMMDSLEKSRDPEYQTKLQAEQRLQQNKEKMDAFLNSTLQVSKSGINKSFNAVYVKKDNNFIKAVIDENNKGYLGSRIRFRLLDDVFVGTNKIPKGAVLYGSISGFSMQRVNLNIISVMTNGEILPVNLAIYDLDGMKGLYVPQSLFRDMIKELGTNSVQGNSMSMGNEGFFTSMFTKLFTSTSTSIANLIRMNKAKLKYNSYVFLIDEKQLKENTK